LKQIYAFFCILLIVVNLPFMAAIWVGGFISALFTIAARSGFNAFMRTHDEFSEDQE
jgi:hypothetical protein